MEDGWQIKYDMKPPSLGSGSGSSLRVASSSEQIQLQQEARNQLNTNMSHCILPHDVREQGPLSSQMKRVPTSNILDFGSCKPIHLEIGSSFCSLSSAPPSLLQYDLQRQLNMQSSSGGCILDTPAQGNVGTMKNWPLLQNSANYNTRAGVDIRPVFSSRPNMNANNGSSHGLTEDLKALRASITHPGSRTENGIITLQKGVTCTTSSSSSLPDASLQASISVPKKQSSVANGYPRVFCMGACGDLLLSNTGLFGVLCSCHGMHMSVSKFCEHSGLSDVNPGYAVRMDSGDSIAQWRKLYLQKFGIRAPGDHRGWDWPEGLLATSGFANSSMAVADKRKVFDMSSLFNSSAESTTQPRNNVSLNKPRPIQDFSNQMVKNDQMACTSSNLRPTLLSDKEGSGDCCHSRSLDFTSSGENSSSPAFLNLQSVGSEANHNSKDKVVQQRGPISSSIELKLGQPSQLNWGSGAVSLPAVRHHTSGVKITTAQEMLNQNLTKAKVSENIQQHIFHHSAPDSFEAKKSLVSGPPKNAPTSLIAGPLYNSLISTDGAAHVVNLKDGLYNDSTNSVKVPSSNSTAVGNLYPKNINRRMNDSHPLSPWTVHYQPHVDRSVLIDFSCNGDPPIRPLDINKSALPNKISKTINATCGNEVSNVGSGSNSWHYTKQMESNGFAKNGEPRNFNSSVLPAAKFSIYGMSNMSSGVSGASNCVSGASNYVRNVCTLASNLERDQCSNKLKIPSLNFRTTSTLQATSTGFTPLYAAATCHGSSFLSKDVEAVNSHTRNESLKVNALGNIDKSSKERPPNASFALDQHSNHKQIENCGIPELRAQGLILDQGPFEAQRHECRFSVGHITSPSLTPDVGHKKGTTLGAISEEITVFSKLTDKYNEVTGNRQPMQQSELSFERQENKGCNCNVVQGCCGSSHISSSCYHNVQQVCSKRKQESKDNGSLNDLKKQESIAILEDPKYSTSRISDDFVSINKAFHIECNQKGKGHNFKLDCGKWTDVPPNANATSKMRFPDATTHLLDSRKESEIYLKELATKGSFKSNQATELLTGKELSDISSDCSAPVVTQASNEVDRIDSGNVDGSHKVCDNGQIEDQGSSAVSISCSDEAIDSVRNSQVSDGDTRSTEEKSLAVLEDLVHHKEIYEFRQTYSNSNEFQSFTVSGGSSDEVPYKTQNENGLKCKKRKRTNKRKMLGTTLNQSNQNTTSCNGVKKGNSALFTANMLSRKRDFNGIYNIVEGETSDQEPVKENNNSIDMPENALIKKVKQVKPPEAVEATEAVKRYALHKPISDRIWKSSAKGFQRVKPVACGKYGIICDQELDIDQLKPPKIVLLSQVLNASRRHAKFEKEPVVPLIKKKNSRCNVGGKHDDVPSSLQSQDSRNKKVWSFPIQEDASIRETQQMHLNNMQPDNADALEVGADRGEINLNTSTSHPASVSKTKEPRMRSLYELSMRGNKLIPADISRFQNVMNAQPTVCGLEMITLKDAERCDGGERRATGRRSCRKLLSSSLMSEVNKLCCVCGISNKDNANCLLECGHCSIQIHQACYGISRVPKGDWYCRPCKTSSKDVACVLCGYGDGAMTRAFGSRNVVKSLLKAWDIRTEPHIMSVGSTEALYVPAKMECRKDLESATCQPRPSIKPVVHNSIISGLFDPTVKQWVHMVCGLWTPGTRCPNVDTMSAFDVSGVSHLKEYIVCYICKRVGGSCIRCCVETCCTYFHPWCAHQKGLLQSEVEGVDRDQIGFYGRCLFHADSRICHLENGNDSNKDNSETNKEEEPTCARTKGYKGKIQGDGGHYSSYQRRGKGGCLVTQVQVDAWHYINRHKLSRNKLPKPSVSDIDHDYRKEYARYKQAKGWKHLVVYKSGIHALGLYTSQFFQRGAMVVEYVGEIVGHRVADKRETEYLSGRKLQYKSACYFFRIDKEQIIDATCKGGIARFVNHSCQPNCVAKVLTIRGEKKVVFLAQRDIYPGEEITYDYHFNREDEGKKIPCFCNSKNCRRYLN